MGNTCARSDGEDLSTVQKLTVGPDYKEFPEKLAGTGIKATASWQATITRAQLNSKREEFWRTRTEGNRRVWLAIKAAVEADAATSLTIIQNNGLKMKKGNITLLEDGDGNLYNIPIFLINNPNSFHNEKKHKTREIKSVEEIIKIKIRKSGKIDDDEFEVLNTSKIIELKKIYSQKINTEPEFVKLFFGGKEIKDNDTFAKNFIENGMVVMAFVKNR
jgi:Ubiquitin-binding domain/Ubiquitin family